MPEEDLALLGRYAGSGDAEAFRALVERHQDMVFAACRRLLDSREDAEDAAQTCFLKLCREAGRVRGSVGGWLHTAAVRASVDMLRRKRAKTPILT